MKLSSRSELLNEAEIVLDKIRQSLQEVTVYDPNGNRISNPKISIDKRGETITWNDDIYSPTGKKGKTNNGKSSIEMNSDGGGTKDYRLWVTTDYSEVWLG